MPRYYFHIFNDETTRDEEGMDLPDEDGARHQAVRSVRDLVCEGVRIGHVTLSHRIEVEDASGAPVLMVHFRDVFDLRP